MRLKNGERHLFTLLLQLGYGGSGRHEVIERDEEDDVAEEIGKCAVVFVIMMVAILGPFV